jgi:hypothetical protein
VSWDSVSVSVRTVTNILPQHLAAPAALGCFPLGPIVAFLAGEKGVELSSVQACAIGVALALPIAWLRTRSSVSRELREKLTTLETNRGGMSTVEKRRYFRAIADEWMREVRNSGLGAAELRIPAAVVDKQDAANR